MSKIAQVSEHLVLLREPNSAVTESYRSLRTKLQLALSKGVKSFCVVSAWGRDGKSTVALNIAHSLSQLFFNVTLIDCDLRKPTLSRLFELHDQPGLAELLSQGGDVTKVLYRTPAECLSFLPAGRERESPADLLGRGHLASLFEQLHAANQVTVVDTSPLAACSDAFLLGPHVGTALFVINAGHWEGESEVRLKESLEDHHFKVLGVILNGAPESERNAGYGYGYGYGYGNGYGYGQDERKPRKASLWQRLFKRGN